MLKGEWQERHQQPSTNVNIAPSNRVTTLTLQLQKLVAIAMRNNIERLYPYV